MVRSYLSDRYQYVSVTIFKSDLLLITQGSPQGPIIGPLLFLIFIKDFPGSNSFFNFSLFADDSTL